MTEGAPNLKDARTPVLEVRGLKVHLSVESGEVTAVDGISFDVAAGETLALVGESGAGKSMASLGVMRLAGKGARGRGVRLEGQAWLHADGAPVDLIAQPLDVMQRLRGSRLSMVFQEPMTSLNPVFRVGWQIAETIVTHEGVSWEAAEARALEMLKLVGIPDPAERQRAFPHELSGGMRQRVMIAMALACRPKLLIADEPTTALDVTVQAQVLDLIRRLQREMGMAVLFITHDLGVVAQVADRVAVMYAGRIVETAGVEDLFESPRHPYTTGLLQSIPSVSGEGAGRMVKPIPGSMPNLQRLPKGCAYHPRCPGADPVRCASAMPPVETAGPGRSVRCFRWAELAKVPA